MLEVQDFNLTINNNCFKQLKIITPFNIFSYYFALNYLYHQYCRKTITQYARSVLTDVQQYFISTIR